MRLLYILLLVIVSVIAPWWCTLILWIPYAFRFRAYELIALGILLDAYFGYATLWHIFYTVSATVLYFGVELLRPRIAFPDRVS